MKASEQFKAAIKNFLDALAERDEAFALSYENPAKSIDECIDYILTTVQKSGIHGFDDDEIYGMAVHYYEEDKPGEIKRGLGANVVVNHHIELTEEEVAEAKRKAAESIQAKEEQRIRDKERKAREAEKARAEAKRKKDEEEGVMSLFGEDML